VIVSTVLIQFYGWIGFDPIASIFIALALLIAASVISLVIDTGKVLALDVAQRADGMTQALDEVASSAHSSLCIYTTPQPLPLTPFVRYIGKCNLVHRPEIANIDSRA
jgi:zinc transporter 5/7